MCNLSGRFATLALATIAFTMPASAQLPVDDLRVRQLESEVQRLQREVDAQARRIEMLEQAARMATPGAALNAPVPHAENTSPAWLVASSWDRIKPGMTTLDVVAILGRPTSTRNTDDGKGRVFFYAMELSPDELLGGSIRFGDAGVVEIKRPVLK